MVIILTTHRSSYCQHIALHTFPSNSLIERLLIYSLSALRFARIHTYRLVWYSLLITKTTVSQTLFRARTPKIIVLIPRYSCLWTRKRKLYRNSCWCTEFTPTFPFAEQNLSRYFELYLSIVRYSRIFMYLSEFVTAFCEIIGFRGPLA